MPSNNNLTKLTDYSHNGFIDNFAKDTKYNNFVTYCVYRWTIYNSRYSVVESGLVGHSVSSNSSKGKS